MHLFVASLALGLALVPALVLPSRAEDLPHITQVSAELEMKDLHATVYIPGPVEPGKPITGMFKNKAVIRITPVDIHEKLIRLNAELLSPDDGSDLYNATFITRYNDEAEIYEKTPSGDLLYRLKINPQADNNR